MRALGGNSTTTVLVLGAVIVVALFLVMSLPQSLTPQVNSVEPSPYEGHTKGPASHHNDKAPSVALTQALLEECNRKLDTCRGKDSTAPKPILKRAVVISANENPFYSFFTPMVTWTWKHRIGLDVIAIMTRNVPDMIVEATRWAGGIPVLVDITWPLGTGKMMQNVRTIAAAIRDQIDDDTVLTTADADMFPLNRSYYDVAPDMTNQLYVHGNHPATLPSKQYPLCYLSMTAKHWREIMDLRDLTLNEALVRMYLEHKDALPGIYFDQDYFYKMVQEYKRKNPEFNVTLVPWYNKARLDFRIWRNSNFNLDQPWIDSPALRPGFTRNNWPRFKEGLLRHIFDKDALAYFDKFRDDYVRDVMNGDDEAKGLRDGFGRESKRFLEEEAFLNRPIY